MKTRHILIPVIAFAAAAILAAVIGSLALGNVANAQTNLPAPANVRAVQGSEIGQAVVSWDAVADATGYTVRWVDLDAAWAAYDANGQWVHLIESKDVQASGNDRHTLNIPNLMTNTDRGYAFAVRTQVDGANSEWSDWVIIRLTVEVDAEAAVEILAASLAISRHASALVAEPLPTSQADFPVYRATITDHMDALDQQVQTLADKGHAARVRRIEHLVGLLEDNTNLILRDRPALLRAVAAEAISRQTLTQTNRGMLFPAAAAHADNQFYRLMTNIGDGMGGSGSVSHPDVLIYSHMDSLAVNVTLGHTFLLVASLMQDPTFVARIQESYDSVNSRISRDIEYLARHGGPNLRQQVIPLARQFVAAGSGDNNYFDRLENRLELVAQENDRIATNERILDQLLNEIDRLAAAAQGMADPGPLAPEDPVSPGFTDSEVRFGQSAALTGPSAALGQGMKVGIEAAFKEANAAGKVHGRTLNSDHARTISYETDPAFANTMKLIDEEQVFALDRRGGHAHVSGGLAPRRGSRSPLHRPVHRSSTPAR